MSSLIIELITYGTIIDAQRDDDGILRLSVIKYKDDLYIITYLGLGLSRYIIYKIVDNKNIEIIEKN